MYFEEASGADCDGERVRKRKGDEMRREHRRGKEAEWCALTRIRRRRRRDEIRDRNRTWMSARAENDAFGCAQPANAGRPAAVSCCSAATRACSIARAPGSPVRAPAEREGCLTRCACSSVAFECF